MLIDQRQLDSTPEERIPDDSEEDEIIPDPEPYGDAAEEEEDGEYEPEPGSEPSDELSDDHNDLTDEHI